VYDNDLSFAVNAMFSFLMSIIISEPNENCLMKLLNNIFVKKMQFTANNIALNTDKIKLIKYVTSISPKLLSSYYKSE
jgi:hypothetical protein